MTALPSYDSFLSSHEALQNEQTFKETLDAFKTLQYQHAHSPHSEKVNHRIQSLLDPSSTWLALSECAGDQLYDHELPSAGILCGIGQIEGHLVMVIANNPCVKAGTYFPITIKKHLRAQNIAMKLKLPCVYLVDSGGIFLPKQAECFADEHHFGRIFYNQAQLSKAGIPQIAVVLGACTAGGAYVPGMADETIMVKDISSLFLAGPPLVKAATGESIDIQTLGGADMHCRRSGVIDHLADNENEALSLCRRLVAQFPIRDISKVRQPQRDAQPPRHDPTELYRFISHDPRMPMEIKAIISRIIDDSNFDEFKPLYGPTLITGYAYIGGYPVAIIANDGILMADAANKATHFIQLACQRQTPLIFLQNITGFMVGEAAEASGIIKHGAKMVSAVACANVPKFTIIIGGSYGAGNYAMCGRAYDPNFLWSWPNAKCAVMGSAQANLVLKTIRSHHSEDDQCKIETHYRRSTSAMHATAHLWDDGILDPLDTRATLIKALHASAHQSLEHSQFGIFRV
ncbi:MAG: methylcrotonoyl-CoA carboxylase [Legionellales bacterium]|nr:methylcrotonoyl-CoA carboxylase [Legionellales bacterium]